MRQRGPLRSWRLRGSGEKNNASHRVIGVRITLPMDTVTDKDREDLAEADRMKDEGRALRRRVLTRIRQRRFKAKERQA